MQPAPDRELKADAAEDRGVEEDRVPAPAAPSSTPEPAAAPAPTPKSANFVEPACRGRKYITPEVFRRRVYAYFGYRPSKSTMHRWLQGGRIAAIRVGKLWLIPESTWEEFLKCCQLGERF
jgi:excisionase family DNA binding protein